MRIPPRLADRIEAIARREGRTTEDLLRSLLDDYERQPSSAPDDSIEDFIGMFDDDITDMSVTVRETLKKKFSGSDDRTS